MLEHIRLKTTWTFNHLDSLRWAATPGPSVGTLADVTAAAGPVHRGFIVHVKTKV